MLSLARKVAIKSQPQGPPQFCIFHFYFCISLHAIRSTNSYVRKNQPFLTNKANFQESQMNVIKALTMDYENKTLGGSGKNKANTNPIQTQSKPIKANSKPKQTQYKPNQSQFQRGLSHKKHEYRSRRSGLPWTESISNIRRPFC